MPAKRFLKADAYSIWLLPIDLSPIADLSSNSNFSGVILMEKNALWKQDKGWWTSAVNFLPEIKRSFSIADRIIIHDATLRDGEQTPGVVFRKEEKVAIARELDLVGVDRIEAGMPAVSEEDESAVKEIVRLNLRAKIMVLCRALQADIDKAVDCGVWGIVIEAPCGVPRLKYQFNWTPEEVIKRSIECINYAKNKGLFVAYFPYDTTRADLVVLRKFITEVTAASNPDSIAIVDTNGCCLPEGIKFLIREVRKLTHLPLEIHTHNDLGLSIANTLAAVEEGAEVVHVCINGIGERCGNAALEEIVVCLKCLLGISMERIDFRRLYELSQLVSNAARMEVAGNKPVVGRLAFTRESGLGMEVFTREPRVAFAIHPEFVGRKFEVVLGKKSGRQSIKVKLAEMGIEASDEIVGKILEEVKRLGIQKKSILSDQEFKEIVKNFCHR